MLSADQDKKKSENKISVDVVGYYFYSTLTFMLHDIILMSIFTFGSFRLICNPDVWHASYIPVQLVTVMLLPVHMFCNPGVQS